MKYDRVDAGLQSANHMERISGVSHAHCRRARITARHEHGEIAVQMHFMQLIIKRQPHRTYFVPDVGDSAGHETDAAKERVRSARCIRLMQLPLRAMNRSKNTGERSCSGRLLRVMRAVREKFCYRNKE